MSPKRFTIRDKNEKKCQAICIFYVFWDLMVIHLLGLLKIVVFLFAMSQQEELWFQATYRCWLHWSQSHNLMQLPRILRGTQENLRRLGWFINIKTTVPAIRDVATHETFDLCRKLEKYVSITSYLNALIVEVLQQLMSKLYPVFH